MCWKWCVTFAGFLFIIHFTVFFEHVDISFNIKHTFCLYHNFMFAQYLCQRQVDIEKLLFLSKLQNSQSQLLNHNLLTYEIHSVMLNQLFVKIC